MLSSSLHNWLKRRAVRATSIDPDRIYIENVRVILGINYKFASYICETATREGHLQRRLTIKCPNSGCERVLATVDSAENLPNIVTCENCLLDERDESEFAIDRCRIEKYYTLVG